MIWTCPRCHWRHNLSNGTVTTTDELADFIHQHNVHYHRETLTIVADATRKLTGGGGPGDPPAR